MEFEQITLNCTFPDLRLFWRNVTDLCILKKIKVSQLARRLGKSDAYINTMKNGQNGAGSDPGLIGGFQIADILGVPLGALMTEDFSTTIQDIAELEAEIEDKTKILNKKKSVLQNALDLKGEEIK